MFHCRKTYDNLKLSSTQEDLNNWIPEITLTLKLTYKYAHSCLNTKYVTEILCMLNKLNAQLNFQRSVCDLVERKSHITPNYSHP
jgi:hypothetical protein